MYKYLDGNNNAYVLAAPPAPGTGTSYELAYVPVTPGQSSSGTYSGGTPKTVSLAAGDAAEIIALLEQIVGDAANRIADRNMGCGTVLIDGERAYTQMHSPLKAQLERLLQRLLA